MKKISALFVVLLAVLSFNISSVDAANQAFMFYLDAEGNVSYQDKDVKEIIKSVQSKMPAGDVVLAAHDKADVLEAIRVVKQQEMTNMLTNYPSYAAINTGDKALMSDDILQGFLAKHARMYDGIVILRLKPMQIKTSANILNTLTLGFGGKNTEADMQVSVIVYTRAKKTVFNNTQVIKANIEGTWAPVAVAKRAVVKVMDNIPEIKTR